MTDVAATIRPLTQEDAAACVAVVAKIGWHLDEATWHMILGVGDGFGVFDGDALVGTIVVNRFGPGLTTIAMMVVVAEHRRRGLALRLMDRALAHAGETTVALYSTVAGRPLYERLGFSIIGSCTRLEGHATITQAAPSDMRPMRAEDMEAVALLDERAQGAPRTDLLRAFFARHDDARVITRGEEIVAFAIGRTPTTHRARVIGPIVARSDDDARALASALAYGVDTVRLDVDRDDRAMLAWGRDAGLAVTETSPLLVRYGLPLPGERDTIRALASRAFG